MTSRPALQVGSIGGTYITKGHKINVCLVHFSDNGESVNSSYLYCNNSFNWGVLRFNNGDIGERECVQCFATFYPTGISWSSSAAF